MERLILRLVDSTAEGLAALGVTVLAWAIAILLLSSQVANSLSKGDREYAQDTVDYLVELAPGIAGQTIPQGKDGRRSNGNPENNRSNVGLFQNTNPVGASSTNTNSKKSSDASQAEGTFK